MALIDHFLLIYINKRLLGMFLSHTLSSSFSSSSSRTFLPWLLSVRLKRLAPLPQVLALAVVEAGAESMGEAVGAAVVEAEEGVGEPPLLIQALILLLHFLLRKWSSCWNYSRRVVVA